MIKNAGRPDAIIKEIQRVAREKGANKLTCSEFISETGISPRKSFLII